VTLGEENVVEVLDNGKKAVKTPKVVKKA